MDIELKAPSGLLPPGASLFAKWRIGKGFGVHVGAWRADEPREAVVKQVRESLTAPLEAGFAARWPGVKLTTSNRRGKSGLIVRATWESWSILDAEERCSEGLAALNTVLFE